MRCASFGMIARGRLGVDLAEHRHGSAGQPRR